MVNGHAAFEMEESEITPYTLSNGVIAGFTEIADERASENMALRASASSTSDNRVDFVTATSMPVLSYVIDVEQPDTYDIYLRAHILNESENSIWIGVDNQPYYWQDLKTNNYYGQFETIYACSVTLSPGRHTIKIIPREMEGIYDKLIVTNHRDFGDLGNYMVSGQIAVRAAFGAITPFDDGTSRATYVKEKTRTASSGIVLRADVVSPAWGGKIDSTDGIHTPTLSIRADIDSSDEYAVWVRTRADSAASDSLWLKNDSASYIQKGLPVNAADTAGQFQWSKLDVVKLAPGEYCIDFIPRENNCVIDKVLLSSDLNYIPTDTQMPQNPSVLGTTELQIDMHEDVEKLIVLSCQSMKYDQFGNFVFTYNSEQMEVIDIAAHLQNEAVTNPGIYGGVNVVAVEEGRITLQPTVLPEPDMFWSGTLTVIKVRGLYTGSCTVALTR